MRYRTFKEVRPHKTQNTRFLYFKVMTKFPLNDVNRPVMMAERSQRELMLAGEYYNSWYAQRLEDLISRP